MYSENYIWNNYDLCQNDNGGTWCSHLYALMSHTVSMVQEPTETSWKIDNTVSSLEINIHIGVCLYELCVHTSIFSAYMYYNYAYVYM